MRILITTILALVIFANNNLFAQCHVNSQNGSNPNSSSASAPQKFEAGTKSIRVNGKCDMCKARIEKAALSVKGVKHAEWNVNTKMLQVDLKNGTDIEDVAQAVTAAGHDTEKYIATDNSYGRLPECCKYR